MTIELQPVFVEAMPDEIEEGKLYISEKYKCVIHLCACGCRRKSVTPIGYKGWTMTKNMNKITLRPSIGNFTGDKPSYHAHYFITDNKVQWL